MDATIMPSPKLLARVRKDFPLIQFAAGQLFSWSASRQTVTYAKDSHADLLLLHELSHAILEHATYQADIELLRQESAAWAHAVKLASHYGVDVDHDFIEDNLDSYRDWLHVRSLCPTCGQIGLQNQKKTYSCLNCRSSWGVNDARQCQLRRTRLQGQNQPAQVA